MKRILGCLLFISIVLGYSKEVKADYTIEGRFVYYDYGIYGYSFECVGSGGICFVHTGPSEVPTFGDDIMIHTGNGIIRGKLTMIPESGEGNEGENPNYGFEPINPDEMTIEF